MKQQIEQIIKKNLPEKDIPKLGSENQDEYVAYSNGFNQALSQINTSLIADEVLKVVVEILEEERKLSKTQIPSYGGQVVEACDNRDIPKLIFMFQHILTDEHNNFLDKIIKKLSNLSPNKENKNNG